MKLIFLLLIVVPISCLSQSQEKDSKLNVGAIRFDPKTDNSDFILCDSTKIYEYYNFGTSYKGEKNTLRNTIIATFKTDKSYKNDNGFIVIRFVVNCKGETDRFRVKQIDENYRPITFSKGLVTQLLNITKTLNNWQPGKREGITIDSYVYLNFIIKYGKLTDVAP